MSTTKDEFSAQVSKIRSRFVQGLDARIDAIRDVMYVPTEALSAESPEHASHRMLHDLAGSAAMLQLADIETAARAALEIAEHADNRGTPFDQSEREAIETVLSQIAARAHGYTT